jgi:predicted Fe-Mo cluster-binding NifX family protein
MNTKQTPSAPMLKIAIPVADGRLHGHFGGCTHFALVEVDRERRTILSTRTVEAPPHTPGLFPRWLHGQGVGTVIAGGIGRRALDLFAQQGIEVRAGQPGVSLEELVTSYLNGALTGTPEGCASHGHHHDHDHGHENHDEAGG